MLQAIIIEDGKYDNLRLSDKLHNGFTEVSRDGNNIILDGNVIEEYVSDTTVEEKISQIKSALLKLDLKTIRPLRAGETNRVLELEAEAQALRSELRKLEVAE